MPDSVNCNLLANEVSLTRQFQAISNRPRQAFRFNSPPGPELNNLFFLSVHDVTYVGRKLLSHSDERGWYQSSCLNPSQLLGQLLSIAYTNNGLAVHFISLEDSQRHDLFHAAIQHPDSEVYFPFPLLDSAGQECTLSQEQWACTPQLAGRLDNDEQHFRDYCAFFLRPMIQPGMVIYDPACSTGTFIGSLAQAFPEAHCIGSDQSATMIEHARNRFPALVFKHMDAGLTQLASLCDVLILRFLNAEVIHRDDAHCLFKHMGNLLKPGATLIVFGHTPVLINVRNSAQALGLRLISSLAARPNHTELFEFYVMKKPGIHKERLPPLNTPDTFK